MFENYFLEEFNKKSEELLKDFEDYYAECLENNSETTKSDATFGFFFNKIASLQVLILEHHKLLLEHQRILLEHQKY